MHLVTSYAQQSRFHPLAGETFEMKPGHNWLTDAQFQDFQKERTCKKLVAAGERRGYVPKHQSEAIPEMAEVFATKPNANPDSIPRAVAVEAIREMSNFPLAKLSKEKKVELLEGFRKNTRFHAVQKACEGELRKLGAFTVEPTPPQDFRQKEAEAESEFEAVHGQAVEMVDDDEYKGPRGKYDPKKGK